MILHDMLKYSHLETKHSQSRKKAHHHPIDRITEVMSFVNGCIWIPQIWKVIQQHSTDGLSMGTFVLSLTCNSIWLLYGIHRKTAPVIISSGLIIMSVSTLLFLHFFVY